MDMYVHGPLYSHSVYCSNARVHECTSIGGTCDSFTFGFVARTGPLVVLQKWAQFKVVMVEAPLM